MSRTSRPSRPSRPTMPNPAHRAVADELDRDLQTDVLVVGAGLAGLTAAVTAAGAGARVVLVDARDEIGGRARSDRAEGFAVNEGAHALYRAGAARSVLRGLGIRPKGKVPLQRRGGWSVAGELVPWRRTSVVGGTASALRAARSLMSHGSARGAEGRSMADWLDEHIADESRLLAEMLVRTTTYCADLDSLDAAATLAQVRLGARGVIYLHGGWQTLVEALLAAAAGAGVDLRSARVRHVTDGHDGVEATTSDGVVVKARAAVLAAGGPAQAASLLGGASDTVARWSARAAPVRAACLDVSLSQLAPGGRRSTYALDEPLYLVDHAATARVAPAGGGLFHGLWYEPDRSPDVDGIARLESALDVAQPGWRARVVATRRRQQAVVAHDRPRPDVPAPQRPSVVVDDLRSVCVAGDWVAGHGMLADAAVGSGHEAGLVVTAASAGRAPLAGARSGEPVGRGS